MPAHDTAEFRPATERAASTTWTVAAVLACAAAAGAAWWFWLRPAAEQPAPAAPPAATSAPAEPAAPPMTEASGPQNLVEGLAQPDAALPPLAQSDARVAALLGELLGVERVARFLVTDNFVRRVVATVDNLARAQAPAGMWPVQPTPERFSVEGPEDAQTVAASNFARYGAAISFAEAVPLDAAVALYARLYPLFQRAYEEVGYPGRYFNDRLVAVLGHLLLAPETTGPLRVKLLPVNTEVANLRPWVRYEFADPALQGLSSGQKVLVRMGPANQARAKVLIRALRRRLATSELAPKPAR